MESTRYLYASKAYLARRGRPKRIADLAEHDLVATTATTSGAVWELFSGKRGRRHRVAFTPRMVVTELFAARNAAIAGAGIALVPELGVEVGLLERILPHVVGPRVGMSLLYPARRSLTAAVRSCVDHLLAQLTP